MSSEVDHWGRPKAPVVSPNEVGRCADEVPVPSTDWLCRSSSSIRNQCFLPMVDRAALRRLPAASSPSSPSPDNLWRENDTPELDISTDGSLDLDVSRNSCASLCSNIEIVDYRPLQCSLETSGRSAWNGKLNLHLARKETLQALAELGRKYSSPTQKPVFPGRIASMGNDILHCSTLDSGTRGPASTECYPAPVIHIGCLFQTIQTTQTENPSHLSTHDPQLSNLARLADELEALSSKSHTDSDSTGPTVEPRSYWAETAWRWACAVVVIILFFVAASVRRVARPYLIDSLPLRRLLVTNWTGREIPQIGVYPFAKDLSYTMTRIESIDVKQGTNVTLLLPEPVCFTAHPSRERDKLCVPAPIHRAAAANRFDCLPFPHPTVERSWLTTKTNVCESQSFAEQDDTIFESKWKEQYEATSASPLILTECPLNLCENPANREVFNPSPEPIAEIVEHMDPALNVSDTSSRRHHRKPQHLRWSALGRLCRTWSRRAHGWIQRHRDRSHKKGDRPLVASFPSFRNDEVTTQMDFMGIPLVEIVGQYLRDRARAPQS
jgi:hypothetical protein